ncbi:MAG: hypothetical protein ABI365_02360 [Lysobacteraceae bacterium]
MKLQVQNQELRFRIDEAELAVLLDGGEVTNTTVLGDGIAFRQSLRLHIDVKPMFDAGADGWRLLLPEVAVLEHVRQLPSKQGLIFEFERESAATLTVRFDVDVRDSIQHRGVTKRRTAEASS